MFTIEKNYFLTAILSLFTLATFAYRIWDVFIKKYSSQGKVYYAWTLSGLSIAHLVVGVLVFSEYLFFVKTYHVILGVLGFLIFFIGQVLRNWAIRSLGDLHSPQIEIKPNHRIISSGAYRFLKHPYYLGALLEVGSLPLIFNAAFSAGVVIFTYFSMVGVRIFLEQKVMREHFGKMDNKDLPGEKKKI